jgi:hypothetical protein
MPEPREVYVETPPAAPQVNVIVPPAAPQVNINTPQAAVIDDSGDRTAGAAINFMTVLIVLAVVVFLAVAGWILISGSLQTLLNGTINVNVR